MILYMFLVCPQAALAVKRPLLSEPLPLAVHVRPDEILVRLAQIDNALHQADDVGNRPGQTAGQHRHRQRDQPRPDVTEYELMDAQRAEEDAENAGWNLATRARSGR